MDGRDGVLGGVRRAAQGGTRTRANRRTDRGVGPAVIIRGYGTFGGTVASRLRDADREVVVVERQEEQYERALDDGLLAVEGDARRGDVLADAGVERATTVVAAIDDTSANVRIAVTGSQPAPTVRLVVRAGDEVDEALARREGADEVVIPEVVSAEKVSAVI